MTQVQWEIEFDRYKQYPEWQQRQSMTLDEFKFIYFWEYGHRMMGRFVGVAFTLPGIYFFAKGMIPRRIYPRIGLLFALGGTQGLIGWWMVRSGLNLDPQQKKEIRVSPYRLATHLSMAFTTYVLLLWTALDVLHDEQAARSVVTRMSLETMKYARRIRSLAVLGGCLAATTVVSGAYVAGNDAGRAYNSFPKMGDQWMPLEDMFSLQPLWRNFFENTATVQFDHRVLAMGTLGAIAAMYAHALSWTTRTHWHALPPRSRLACHLVAGMGLTQVGLGITTLLLYVPIPLAALHQSGSLVLLTFITGLVHSLKFVKRPIAAAAAPSFVPATALFLPNAVARDVATSSIRRHMMMIPSVSSYFKRV